MKKATKYGLMAGSIVGGMLIVFGIKNYLVSMPNGLNWGTAFDYLLLSPALPLWKLLTIYPSEPLLLYVILRFTTIVVFWSSIGYLIGIYKDNTRKITENQVNG